MALTGGPGDPQRVRIGALAKVKTTRSHQLRLEDELSETVKKFRRLTKRLRVAKEKHIEALEAWSQISDSPDEWAQLPRQTGDLPLSREEAKARLLDYLDDEKGKRRRMRSKPSNQVLWWLERLLEDD